MDYRNYSRPRNNLYVLEYKPSDKDDFTADKSSS